MRRLTFRSRLALTMIILAVVGGSVLLGLQLLLTQGAFLLQIDHVEIGNAPPPGEGPATQAPPSGVPGSSSSSSGAEAAGVVTQIQQSVLTIMVVGSIVLLVLFALVVGFVSWRLAGRFTRRVAAITRLTREVSGQDLAGRLALSGPHDEIRELGEEIDTMLERLEDAFQRQERFIANASHELRTPLTATRTALEAPLVQGRFPADVEPAVRRALAATEGGSTLITALLDLATTESTALDRTPEALDRLTEAVCAEHAEEAARRTVRLVTESEPAVVSAQHILLAQAIGNLVGNAVRYSPPDSTIAVSVRVVRDDGPTSAGFGVLEISNAGPVLSADEIVQLVEPFHRGQLSRRSNEPGVGLGLALVDAVARRHDGRLDLRARTGGGLIVALRLPLAPAAVEGHLPG